MITTMTTTVAGAFAHALAAAPEATGFVAPKRTVAVAADAAVRVRRAAAEVPAAWSPPV